MGRCSEIRHSAALPLRPHMEWQLCSPRPSRIEVLFTEEKGRARSVQTRYCHVVAATVAAITLGHHRLSPGKLPEGVRRRSISCSKTPLGPVSISLGCAERRAEGRVTCAFAGSPVLSLAGCVSALTSRAGLSGLGECETSIRISYRDLCGGRAIPFKTRL